MIIDNKKKCDEFECGKNVHARGKCVTHYKKEYRQNGTKAWHLVDVEPVKKWMTFLLENGQSFQRISRISGIGNGTLYRLYYGSVREGKKFPTHRVLKSTADKIFAVDPSSLPPVGRGADTTGLVRRIQALWIQGHAYHRISSGAKVAESTVLAIVHGKACLQRTRVSICEYYELNSKVFHCTAEVAKKRAKETGFFPASAWRDKNIDDPHEWPTKAQTVDMVAVQQVADGFYCRINRAETSAAKRILESRGLSDYSVRLVLTKNREHFDG